MKSLFILLLICTCTSTYSQRISTFFSAGLGTSLEDNIEGCSKQNRSRYIGSGILYFRVNDRFSIGAEAITSGRLDIFGKSGCDIINPDNSLQLSPSNLKSGTVLLHGKFNLFQYKEMEPYISIGTGVNTYYYSEPVKGAAKLKKVSPVISPEIGINMYKFQFACKLIIGGKTPSFNGIDENDRVVTLQSTKPNQLYLTIGYQLFKL